MQSLTRYGGNFDGKVYTSEEVVNKLKWWIRIIFYAFAPIKLPLFDVAIFSDASLEGRGGVGVMNQ